MATNTLYRVTLAMPVAAVVLEGSAEELASWLNAQLGQSTCPDDLGPQLSPTGGLPATHHWCSTGWTAEDCRSMLGHLADLAGIERPSLPVWNGWTLEERCAWGNDTLHPALFTNTTGGVLMEDALGDTNPFQLLALMDLKRYYPPPPPRP